MSQFLLTLLKISGFSLLVGIALSVFGISAADLLESIGLTPLDVWIYILNAIDWAVPTMLLGALIVVPIWIVIFLLRPPGN
ncbi:DUF6460 domain-containing protein [Roseibium limicola]|uniref:DUF6460 domain-containing protein n=1 Tax=Roseibium limicola TaxID=2816037 RepID=A0A939J9D6_9HYPH|nr:DUF6460 domain-containing protein [Roseibium limicola]MBO0345789.1 hypothetical protein [Roseibium limicola]